MVERLTVIILAGSWFGTGGLDCGIRAVVGVCATALTYSSCGTSTGEVKVQSHGTCVVPSRRWRKSHK